MCVLRRALAVLVIVVGAIGASDAAAAPYAALVMDARTGEVLHARSADQRLHPASLTKMMTLYLAFEAVTSGRISLDKKVKVSRHAAGQVPSKIGLRAGQRVTIRHLIRATAVKSANDAATALAEALGGTERAFAQQMTERAKRLGMRNTNFRNASGLTAKGQYSSARDMALLGRALFYNFPQYYNLFGRKKTHAAGKTIYNTNRRLLGSYRGADGIKTGYTNAAGYNLVSSAERGDKRIIAVVFGGKTSRWRNARVAELLDMGFKRAPAKARVRKPATTMVHLSPAPRPRPGTEGPSLLARAGAEVGAALAPAAAQASEAPIVYSAMSPRRSPAPIIRPGGEVVAAVTAAAAEIDPPKGVWAVQLGVFAKEETAIAELASAALSDVNGLDHAGREVSRTKLKSGPAYRARLTGFDEVGALTACAELKARGKPCLPIAERN